MTDLRDNKEPTNFQNPDKTTQIEGALYIKGDFIGRDKIVQIATQVVQQAVSAVEEARQAHDLSRQRLAEGVRSYAQHLAAIAADRTDTRTTGPYKGLLSYSLGDAELFYGRDRAIKSLLSRMELHPLTVLQSVSGAGKSSLLRAGIAPRLLAAGHLPVILRPYNRPPDLVIKQALLPDLSQTPDLRDAPLRAFLRPVTDVLGSQATLVLILDQFEEFFTLLTDDVARAHFVRELADCIEDESLSVRWILAVRSEFFGDLATFQPRIRNPFQNYFRLERLSHEEARDVITQPAARFDITYAPALVTQLLHDLIEESGVHPPQIQLVCLALYQALIEEKQNNSDSQFSITEQLYEKEGGAAGILRGHLNRVLLRSLPTRQERDLARSLLVELVSSEQRRIRRTRSDLAAALATGIVAVHTLGDVLNELVENRLLNVEKDEEKDDHSYEIAHDYLLSEIKVDPEVQAQKAAQELLAQEFDAYQRYKTLLDKDKYQIINSQRSFLRFDEPTRAFLEESQQRVEREEREREEARQRELEQERELRLEKEKAANRLRFGILILTLLVVVALGTTVYALSQTKTANYLRRGSLVQALSAQALNAKDDLGALLAREAYLLNKQYALGFMIEVDQALRSTLDDTFFGHNLPVYRNWILSTTFSPDNRFLITGDSNNRVVVWEQTSLEQPYAVLTGHQHWVWSVDISPDGQRLASGSLDGTVRVWDMTHLDRDPTVLVNHQAEIYAVKFSPNGHSLAAGSSDGTILLWNMEKLDQEPSRIIDAVGILSMAFTPDGKTLAVAGGDTVRLWSMGDLASEPTVLRGHEGRIWSIDIHPDGDLLASASEDKTVRLWKLNHPGAEPRVIRSHSSSVMSVAFSPMGELLASSADDQEVHLWNLNSLDQQPIPLAGHDSGIRGLSFSPDGRWLASGGLDRTVRFWDLSQPNQVRKELRGHQAAVTTLAYHQDGKHLASGSTDQTVRIWNTDEPLTYPAVLDQHSDWIYSIAFSPDSKYLAVGEYKTMTVRIWDWDSHQTVSSFSDNSGWIETVAYHPDGTVVATAGRGSDQGGYPIRLWQVTPFQTEPLAVLVQHQGVVKSIVFSPDGNKLYSASTDNTILQWDLTDIDTPPAVIGHHNDEIWSLAISPNGEILASGGKDLEIRIWHLNQSKTEPIILTGHNDLVRTLAFSPDGRTLASGSYDKTVRLWSLADGSSFTLETTWNFVGRIFAVKFSPDGGYVAAGSDNGTIYVQLRDPELLAQDVCRKVIRNLSMEEWETYIGEGIPYRRTCTNLPSGHGTVPTDGGQ